MIQLPAKSFCCDKTNQVCSVAKGGTMKHFEKLSPTGTGILDAKPI